MPPTAPPPAPAPRHDPPAAASGPTWQTRLGGGVLATVGFVLSPLSWWNDLFVNVPLALAGAWAVSWFWPAAFTASFVGGYLLTNVAGLVLLQKGARRLVTGTPAPYTRRALCRDVGISILYTGLILLLVELGVIEPLPHYFRPH